MFGVGVGGSYSIGDLLSARGALHRRTTNSSAGPQDWSSHHIYMYMCIYIYIYIYTCTHTHSAYLFKYWLLYGLSYKCMCLFVQSFIYLCRPERCRALTPLALRLSVSFVPVVWSGTKEISKQTADDKNVAKSCQSRELRGSQGRGFEHRSTWGFEHVKNWERDTIEPVVTHDPHSLGPP